MRLLQLVLSVVQCGYYVFRYVRGSDVILSRDRFSFLLALPASKLMNKPIVYQVNGVTSEQRKMHGEHLLNRLYVWLLETLEKTAFKNAARIVCTGYGVRDFYHRRFPQYAEKCDGVTTGFNPKLFRPLPIDDDLGELRARLGFDEQDEIVAYVGSLSAWQGVGYLIESAPAVLKENPDVRFMMVGHGPLGEKYRRLTEELGVNERFKFVGQVPYPLLGQYINLADVCVAPYTRDLPNCSVKIYEYLACGKPAICSDIPGIINLRDSGALILIDPERSDKLARAILETLQDMELRTAQREIGPSIVSEYTWENTAGRIAAICETVAGKAEDRASTE
jgi:glycosyltransferase involved in cell wall biosynthesis